MPTNTLLTADMITREALRVMHNTMHFSKTIDRQLASEFANEGGKIGTSIRIRKPAMYTVGTTAAVTAQDYTEQYSTLTANLQRNVALSFTSAELTMSLDDFSSRIIQPAASRLATEVDYLAMSMALDIANSVGSPGTTPASLLVYLEAAEKMDYQAAPRDGNRHVCIGPAAQAATVDALKGLFHSSSEVENQYEAGLMGMAGGFKFGMSQNIRTLTTGARNTSYQTNEASGTTNGDTTLGVDTGTGTIADGEVFTIAGVYEVNPETKESTGQLKQFVNIGASAGGTVTLTLGEPLYKSGPFQNFYHSSGDIPDNTAITFLGSASTAYPQNLAYHRDAFTLATVPLALPKGMDMAARAESDGISVRFVRGYDVTNDAFISRLDVLFGFVAQRPGWACRIWG